MPYGHLEPKNIFSLRAPRLCGENEKRNQSNYINLHITLLILYIFQLGFYLLYRLFGTNTNTYAASIAQDRVDTYMFFGFV